VYADKKGDGIQLKRRQCMQSGEAAALFDAPNEPIFFPDVSSATAAGWQVTLSNSSVRCLSTLQLDIYVKDLQKEHSRRAGVYGPLGKAGLVAVVSSAVGVTPSL
jgi:hypothetical protein